MEGKQEMKPTKRDYYENVPPDSIMEFIESGEPFYFEYDGKEYLVEGFFDLGYVIASPAPYYAAGGWPEKNFGTYPSHLQAKTVQEFMALPFLDGKTIFERFDELRFFDL
jgi:hypothetical protein